MKKLNMTLVLAVAAMATAPLAASAAIVGLPDYNIEEVYSGFRAEQLLGQAVKGLGGEDIGEVEDIIIGTDNKIAAIVVEGGGFLGIADGQFRIPFAKVDMTPGADGIVIPTSDDLVDEYDMFAQDDVATGPREYRVGELTGDTVRSQDRLGYGRVDDVIFDESGKLVAVTVNRSTRYGGGLYATPFYGYDYDYGRDYDYKFDPGLNTYSLPYTGDDLKNYKGVVDYNRFGNGVL